MVKKWFALASVTALTGLVSAVSAAGCTSKDDTTQKAADVVDSGKKTETGPAATAEAGAPTATKEPTCMATESIDASKYPYTKAGVAKGACTAKEAEDLTAFFAKHEGEGSIKVADWKTSVGEGCGKCVFSDGTGATWTPILAAGEEVEQVNRGGCIEALSGKEACGKTYQQVNDCRMDACLQKCETQEEFGKCIQDLEGIFTGPCRTAYNAMIKECGDQLGTYENGCAGTNYTFEGPVKVMCVNGGGG